MVAEKKYVVAHDVGTGGSKAALVDLQGNIIASHFASYKTSYPKEHWAEQDPEDWWSAVCSTTKKVLDTSGTDPDEVRGVIFGTQMLGVLPVDRTGTILRPAIIWLDGRAQEQADRIIRRMSKTLLFALAGGIPTGKDVVCKIMWLRDNEPKLYENVYKIMDVDSYLVYRSTGEYVYDYSTASVTGGLNFKHKDWDRLLFRLFGLDVNKMPPMKASSDRAGVLTQRAADELGLHPGTTVFCGAGDVPCAAVGSGAVGDGEGHVYIGSSSWITVTMSKSVNDGRKGIFSMASADPDKHLLIAEMESAGACFKWFADTLSYPDERDGSGERDVYQHLNQLASGVAPGANKLIFCPWMYGERAPIRDTRVRGSFINLSLDHTRADMVRAVMEGVALHNRWMLAGVQGCGFKGEKLRAIGGGAISDLWMQIFADVLGLTIERVKEPQESGARGAALIASVGLGVYPGVSDLGKFIEVTGSFEPRGEYRKLYEDKLKSFQEVYHGLKKLYWGMNE